MRQIEDQMHGAMTASERLEKITKIINDYKIEVEEETNLPYSQAIKRQENDVSIIARLKALDEKDKGIVDQVIVGS